MVCERIGTPNEIRDIIRGGDVQRIDSVQKGVVWILLAESSRLCVAVSVHERGFEVTSLSSKSSEAH
jgi:hypothetical protein